MIVLYISNDEEKEDFKSFYAQVLEESSWCALEWNDPRIIDVKNEFRFEAVPRVVVLDKNFQIVTTEAADDLIILDSEECRAL